jgi:hypothetical protein
VAAASRHCLALRPALAVALHGPTGLDSHSQALTVTVSDTCQLVVHDPCYHRLTMRCNVTTVRSGNLPSSRPHSCQRVGASVCCYVLGHQYTSTHHQYIPVVYWGTSTPVHTTRKPVRSFMYCSTGMFRPSAACLVQAAPALQCLMHQVVISASFRRRGSARMPGACVIIDRTILQL